MGGKEEDQLGLSLSLGSPSPPPPLPFFLHPQTRLLLSPSERRSSMEMPEFLRRIDVNLAPAPAAEEREISEEEPGASSPNSTLWSVSWKRGEREPPAGGYEHPLDRAGSRGASDEEDADGSRKKLRLSKDQSAVLEESFKEHSTLNPKQKQALAKQLNLRPRQVEVWFQNRRARTKLKQTEVDCEYLKRCCESLAEENRRLQKEVQELRALKLSPHLCAHVSPATTLTMCPSCERVSNSAPSSAAPPPSYHRPMPMPWAPIPIRPTRLDAPPPRS